MSTFASPRSVDCGHVLARAAGSSAICACISPSTSSSASRPRTIATASETVTASGWRDKPKLAKESIATCGSTPTSRAKRRVDQRDVGEGRGVGGDVHGGVGEEHGAALRHDDVHPRGGAAPVARPDELQREPDRLRVAVVQPRHEPVGVPLPHHHQPRHGRVGREERARVRPRHAAAPRLL